MLLRGRPTSCFGSVGEPVTDVRFIWLKSRFDGKFDTANTGFCTYGFCTGLGFGCNA